MIADINTYESCMLARCLIFCDIRCLYRNRTSFFFFISPFRVSYQQQQQQQQVGLFLYDIFWVFGTDVMVSVATKFDAPIKLLFPRALATEDSGPVLQMLGLGDIVMPGLFIAILLRYDFYRASGMDKKKISTKDQVKLRETLSFDKPFFNSCIFAYIAGLILTVFVMYTFKHAQPALLYLVPACLGSALVMSLMRGEFVSLFAFSEEPVKDEKAKQ